ncbi:MAG: hypothetical protein D6732_25615 [Methanobacteriota archaeon]|nr:MAG: hypothetical protein D6732_25615 [Euryarchaeota archaeon]
MTDNIFGKKDIALVFSEDENGNPCYHLVMNDEMDKFLSTKNAAELPEYVLVAFMVNSAIKRNIEDVIEIGEKALEEELKEIANGESN